MTSVNPATLPDVSHDRPSRRVGIFSLGQWRISASLLILLSLFVLILPNLGRGDELTGQAQDDPKDLLPAPPAPPQPTGPTGSTGAALFAPMPGWCRLGAMPPLPDQLKPLGKKITVAANPAPPPLAPPKETTPAPPAQQVAATAKTPPAPAETTPGLIAVSPFLQWVKTNPQAAAAQARQQANGYHVPPSPEAGNGGPTGVAGDPYWLPPLIDSPDIIPGSGAGSAAIYTTPQR